MAAEAAVFWREYAQPRYLYISYIYFKNAYLIFDSRKPPVPAEFSRTRIF